MIAIISIFVIGLYLLAIGEFVAVEATLIVTAFFFPIYLASRFINSSLLQMVVGFSLLSQIINVPIFFVNRDSYTTAGWSSVKGFAFTIDEFISVYLLLAYYLTVLVIFMGFFVAALKLPPLPVPHQTNHTNYVHSRIKKTGKYLSILIVCILLLVPLHMWMFNAGIAMTGVNPPSLPFRLAGILFYATHLVVPLLLALIYSKTSRNYLPAVVMMVYALILGSSQVSKGAVIVVMLPVFYCAIRDKRYVLFILSSGFSLVAVQIVVLLRNVVYLSIELSGANSTGGLILALAELLTTGFDSFSLGEMFAMLANRTEGVQGIVLAYQFNVDQVGGVLKSFKWLISDQWDSVDVDAYHMELIGVTLPEGNMMVVVGLLAKSLLMTKSQPVGIAFFALCVAAFLLLGEWMTRTIANKYANRDLYFIASGVYCLFFYIGSGSIVFLAILSFLLLIAMLPIIRFRLSW